MLRPRFLLLLLTPLALLLLSFTEIEWTPARRLSWSDYTGPVSSASKFSALSSCALSFQFTGKGDSVTVIVKSLFYPGKSWVKTNSKNEALLAHEQLHFDITELYARKLRKEILGMKLTMKTAQKQLMSAYRKNFKALSKAQSQYDSQSKHSLNKPSQAAWISQVQKDLQSLSGYTMTTLRMKLKR